MWVPLSSALADVHLCGVDTAWLWEAAGESVFLGQITVFLQHVWSTLVLTQYDAVALYSNATFTQGSYAKRPNLILLLTTNQLSQLNSVWSYICCFQALNTKFV